MLPGATAQRNQVYWSFILKLKKKKKIDNPKNLSIKIVQIV